MASKKNIFLFLALALPVLIFLFLKMFGKNEFEVPLLHEQGVNGRIEGCDFDYSKPYRLPDSVFNKIDPANNAPLIIVNFSENVSSRLQRIADDFKADSVVIKDGTQGSLHIPLVKRCAFVLQDPSTIVLVDDQKRIRGYYDGTDRDELDRLDDEISIILKKY
jgi:hypothetical protein